MTWNEGVVIGYLSNIANALSLVGCTFVIANYHLIYRRFLINASESIKTHHISLLLLSINNVFLNAGGLVYSLLNWREKKSICLLQGLHITYFNVSSWLWGVCICFNVYLILLPSKKLLRIRHNIAFKFAWFSFGIPTILLITLVAQLDSIGNVGPWCWIRPQFMGLRMGAFYGWLLFAFTMCLLLLSVIAVHLLKIRSSVSYCDRGFHHPYEKMVGRYVLYVGTFFICWGPGVVNRILQISDPPFYNFPLMAIHTFLSISVSFWLSLVWGFTTSLPEVYWIIWKYGWSNIPPVQQFGSFSSAFTGLKRLEVPRVQNQEG
ncbi:hypothetical protein K493DRAFT_19960 [Basidiobolus meristosporus CBS 931.73]|uniref:G-protein coupled receptors family 2 profile 2 domain-containing protein n=1 Tax=Basidiobolus meristosporus CBS 931.73 TaxID=1314790 RepID=A0A1Y1YE96_9FUNG|nr:hypothetical protein K493DRAFT_19960 [Basidiobolus meristosporus CBS 931.73]|eukprot:ORX96371.1 hypothetical protein K493DRAFT_19960 [Basidiobolus meristosporus CBS 931.73]